MQEEKKFYYVVLPSGQTLAMCRTLLQAALVAYSRRAWSPTIEAGGIAKDAIRAERHPNDTDKPGDVE